MLDLRTRDFRRSSFARIFYLLQTMIRLDERGKIRFRALILETYRIKALVLSAIAAGSVTFRFIVVKLRLQQVGEDDAQNK